MTDQRKRELLQAYADDTISTTDRHLLEREALDDPFLFEALEGYAVVNDAKLSILYQPAAVVRKVQFKIILTVAASLMALAAVVFVMSDHLSSDTDKLQVNMGRTEEASIDKEIAMHDIAMEESQQPVLVDQPMSVPQEVNQTRASKKRNLRQPTSSASVTIDDEAPQDNEINQAIPLDQAISVANASATTETEEAGKSYGTSYSRPDDDIKKTTPASKTQKEGLSTLPTKDLKDYQIKTGLAELQSRVIKGRVTDINGEPLVGAPVSIDGTNTATLTDKTGLYELPIAPSDSPVIAVSYNGFMGQKIPMSQFSSDSFNVILEQNGIVLDEVVVPGYTGPNAKSSSMIYPDSVRRKSTIKDDYQKSVVKGTVTDNYGDPLIGAAIHLIGSEIGTITDIHGEYELVMDSSNHHAIEVSYTGYLSEQVNISDPIETSIYDVILEEAVTLDEIVVTGYQKNARRAKPSITASPEIGYDSFQQFIEENINRQHCTAQGTVTLSFRIKKNGEINKIKIEKSLHPACDQEAIRLLQSAGRWATIPSSKRHHQEIEISF